MFNSFSLRRAVDLRATVTGLLARALSAVLLLSACGGGDPLPAGTVVGAAGGTVTGPNGAQVVIPAGALAANTTIAIAQSAAGAPAMPGGFAAFGQTFAFTPHGTTFAVPVTITVPFDPSMVPAGRTPVLYKTNAQSQWELVANATVSAGNLTAQVSSFSWTAIGNFPPVITQQPSNMAVVEPMSASFTVVGSGGGTPTLQWQRSNDGGATWFNLVDGPAGGSGTTTATYTTAATSVAGGDNNAVFRVVVTSTQGWSIMSLAVTLTVTAAPPTTARLTVMIVGSGTVISTPAGINCPGECIADFLLNTAVTFTPSPAPGFVFQGWSGAGCVAGSVTMSAARNCTATFTAVTPPPGDCAVTFSGTGAAHLPTNCFNATGGSVAGAIFSWSDLTGNLEILLEQSSGSTTNFRYVLISQRFTTTLWNLFIDGGIPGILRNGNQVTFTNVNALGFGGTTLTLNGTLTVPMPAATSLTGTWISTYQCTGTGGNFQGQDTLTLTQTGANVSFTSQSDGGSFTGTLGGNTMTYAGGIAGQTTGYTENGTWTMLANNNSFSKTSTYTRLSDGLGGTCTGTGQRQ